MFPIQAQLLDSFYGIDRGLQASTEVRAEISELITRLEAHNPTAAPNQVLPALYTLSSMKLEIVLSPCQPSSSQKTELSEDFCISRAF